jgi:hypothetical protein
VAENLAVNAPASPRPRRLPILLAIGLLVLAVAIDAHSVEIS